MQESDNQTNKAQSNAMAGIKISKFEKLFHLIYSDINKKLFRKIFAE
jgi:hypothetical protein